MIDIQIIHVGVYTNCERNRQSFECASITFNISGLVSLMENGIPIDPHTPMLKISSPRSQVVFNYNKHRENWVVLFNTPDLKASPKPGHISVNYKDQWIDIPKIVPVENERVAGLRMEFQRIMEYVQSPYPRNQMMADLGVINLVRTIMNHNTGLLNQSPAAMLRQLIDDDTSFQYDISDLSQQCNLSVDHIRSLFRKEYNMSPVRYRNHRRMALAMEYIANSRLTVSEVSSKLGYAHISHFSTVFHECFSISPTQAIKKFRHGTYNIDVDGS